MNSRDADLAEIERLRDANAAQVVDDLRRAEEALRQEDEIDWRASAERAQERADFFARIADRLTAPVASPGGANGEGSER